MDKIRNKEVLRERLATFLSDVSREISDSEIIRITKEILTKFERERQRYLMCGRT